MNNKGNYNIVFKLDTNKLSVGNLSTNFRDHNENVNLNWSPIGSPQVVTSRGINVIYFNTTSNRLYSDTVSNLDIKTTNFVFEAYIKILSFKSDNMFFSIGNSSASNSLFTFNIRNSLKDNFVITCNNQSIGFNYKFLSDGSYHIIVTKDENIFTLYIDGMVVGYCESSTFVTNMSSLNNMNYRLGSRYYTTDDTLGFVGEMSSVNISIGYFIKYNESITKYGDKLVSRLNFNNLKNTTISTYGPNLEAVKNSIMNWSYGDFIVNSNDVTLDGTILESNISNKHTIFFDVKNKKQLNNIDLVNLNDKYKIIYDCVVGTVEPEPVVNTYTKSALDFEDGLNDKIVNTIWEKSGTADITANNKLFGEHSFETKALGDSLYTNSNVITGGATPFTIEFYNVLNPDFSTTTVGTDLSLYAQPDSQGYYQGLFVTKETRNISYYRNGTMPNLVYTTLSSYKINVNDVNKYTITYDGAAIRVFVNDKLTNIIGSGSGHIITNQPFQFLSYNFNTSKNTTSGIIDNINIFDGIATKVRDYDPYEEYLVVDLAFDGENNSKKIVDNGSARYNWTVNSNAIISTDQKFDGFSSLKVQNGSNIRANIDPLYLDDFTICFDIYTTSFTNYDRMFQIGTNNTPGCLILYSMPNSTVMHSQIVVSGSTYSNIVGTSYLGYNHNKYNSIRLTRDKGVFNFYVNGTLVQTNNSYTTYSISSNIITIGANTTNTEGITANIKNFKIYKGVAIVPESHVGKIQLDFDDNLNDKYGNSTWTNNGVTFDQLNSVKGYSLNIANNKYITTNNQNLNFSNVNSLIEFDVKPVSDINGYSNVMSTNSISFEFMIRTNATGVYKNGVLLGLGDRQSFVLNNYYNWKMYRTSNGNTSTLKFNDVIVDIKNSDFVDFDLSDFMIGHSTNSVNAYIDNFKTTKNYTDVVIIDKPVLHLPLETNAANIGVVPLTVTSVGSPVYTEIADKKCIVIEKGKYLTVNTHNIFNLGNNSDFYIEFDFYPVYNSSVSDNFQSILSNNISWSSEFEQNSRLSIIFNQSTNNIILEFGPRFSTDWMPNVVINDKWNKLSISRKGNVLNFCGTDYYLENSININLSISNLFIGVSGWDPSKYHANGYMSNFKMFVGTSEIPETYNDKKVLDLDFKPTGKSYLFKDNNNKCIIHPVNITQRDYQDSQYCCTFNGTNQHLQLGKNDLFNFGKDDFVIEIVFSTNVTSKDYQVIFAADGNTADRTYIALRGSNLNLNTTNSTNDGKQRISLSNTMGDVIFLSNNKYEVNKKTKITFVKSNDSLTLFINDILDSTITTYSVNGDKNQLIRDVLFNFNLNNNTIVGKTGSNNAENFDGTIYSIKVLRNTTDLSLLEDINQRTTFEKFTLTNGVDSEFIEFNSNGPRNIKLVSDEDKVTLNVNNSSIEVYKDTEVDNIKMFKDYTSNVSDIKVYDTAIYDNDEFIGSPLVDSEYPELEIDTDDYVNTIDTGGHIIKGFVEGYLNPRYSIYNKVDDYELDRGIGDYHYDGIDIAYVDDYEIINLDNNTRRPIPMTEMVKGYITVRFILSNDCTESDFMVRVYNKDLNRLIGEYELINGSCTIDNVDCNSRYDCIFVDRLVVMESRTLSNRIPVPYG